MASAKPARRTSRAAKPRAKKTTSASDNNNGGNGHNGVGRGNGAGGGSESMPMSSFTERAYLDYSMYVILDRALPSVADGLKPVQRRIVYAMSELALHANAKYKKSARTVGDVLGKFHPHGDSACYEAMVLMAQPFSYRYPLIDGQGNWGSSDDPKSFAAMRYTESRLTAYAEVLLSELGQGTVEWVANFDGTLKEPRLFPARLPNLLLNGTQGIAVGMATDIPPHNVHEVVNACVALLDKPKIDLAELTEHILGPDFPTEAEIITPKEDIMAMYRSGNGSVRQRAVWQKESGDIVITALPYQVSGSKVQEQIASQMTAKKLPMVSDIRDESDHENPIRIVIEPRSNRIDVEQLMTHLFATTDLERSYRVNMNAIGLDGRPRVFDLKAMLVEWLSYRTQTVRARLQHRLDRINERLHILDGYIIAYLNIDEVIHIIRTEDEPKPVLMKRFKLSDTQATAILDLRLRHLAKLEEEKIRGEKDELSTERGALEKILNSKARLKRVVRDELIADGDAFGDPRRSPIVERETAKALDQKSLIPAEPITAVLSRKGWIRAGRGHELDPRTLNYRSGDGFACAAKGKTNQSLMCLDSTGRAYTIAAHGLPSARSLGEPLASQLNPPAGAYFVSIVMGDEDDQFLLSSSDGYGFVAPLKEMDTRNKAGKALVRVAKGASLLPVQQVQDYDNDWVAAFTNTGRMLVFAVNELPQLNKGKGVKLINIPKAAAASGEEQLLGAVVFQEGDHIKVVSGRRHVTLKPADIDHYLGERARRGLLLPKGFRQIASLEVEHKTASPSVQVEIAFSSSSKA